MLGPFLRGRACETTYTLESSSFYKGVARFFCCCFFTDALAEFQHVNCTIVRIRIWDVKRVACYARAETFTEAVASMVAMDQAGTITL